MLTYANLVTLILLVVADGWVKTVATPIFEAACIFWIYQGLFRKDNPLTEADRLKDEIELLKTQGALD